MSFFPEKSEYNQTETMQFHLETQYEASCH